MLIRPWSPQQAEVVPRGCPLLSRPDTRRFGAISWGVSWLPAAGRRGCEPMRIAAGLTWRDSKVTLLLLPRC